MPEALSIVGICDLNGNSLVGEADEALQKIEDHIQAHMDGNLLDPPDKPYKVVIEIEVLGTGQSGRTLDFSVDIKYPSTKRKHTQLAASVDGRLVGIAQTARQTMLPLERLRQIDEETGEIR